MMIIAIAALLISASVPTAVAIPEASALVGGLSGRWVGTLSYRDYQSDKREELPMVSEVSELPDGATMIVVSRFNDGPRAGIVTITDVSLFDDQAHKTTTAAFRKGDSVELNTTATNVSRFIDRLHWSIVYLEEGVDNDRPASLRVTQTRDGDVLMAIKEVQYKTPGAPWLWRNGQQLHRDAAAASP